MTVVVATHNRGEMLELTLKSILRQADGPAVLVVDDGSTVPVRRGEWWPSNWLLIRHDQPQGCVGTRDIANRLVDTPLVLSIDDDAGLLDPLTVRANEMEFADPAVAVVGIPVVDVNYRPMRERQMRPEHLAPNSFVGTAHMLRVSHYTAVGGYRVFLDRQGEERDLAVRLLDAGFKVVHSGRGLIHHYESPIRDHAKQDIYGRRNDLLFVWLNAPPSALLPASLYEVLRGLRWARHNRRFRRLLAGWTAAILIFQERWRERRPVSSQTWRSFRRAQRA